MDEDLYAAPKADEASSPPDRSGGEGSSAWSRVGVSLACVAAVVATQHVVLPVEGFESLRGTTNASIGALGLAPFISAAVLVELVSLLRPAWRRSRVSGVEFRVWDRASLALGVVIAAVQAQGVALMLEGMMYSRLDGSFGFEVNVPLVVLALTGGALLHLGAARIIERWGFGNGFAWLLLVSNLERLLQQGNARVENGEPLLLQLLAALALVGLFALLLAGAPLWDSGRLEPEAAQVAPESAQRAPLLRLFPCGNQTAWGVTLLAYLELPARHSSLVDLLLIGPLAFAFGAAFYPASRVAGLRRALGLDRAEPRQISRVRLGYVLLTIALICALRLAAEAHPELEWWVVLLPATCVVIDLVQELRALLAGLTVRIWWFQRVYAADAAVQLLAKAGVPAVVRGIHFRSLFHTFGPFLPLALLVSPQDVKRAKRLLEARMKRERIA